MKNKIYSTTYFSKIQYRDYKFSGEDFEILNYMAKSLHGLVKSINPEKRDKFVKKNTDSRLADSSYLASNVSFYLELCKNQLNIA